MNKKGLLYEKKSNKKAIILMLIFLVISFFMAIAGNVLAENNAQKDIEDQLGDAVDKELDGLDLSELQKYLDSLESKEMFKSNSFKEIISGIINGTESLSSTQVFKTIFKAISGQALSYLPLMLTIVAISLIFSIVDGLSSGFLNSNTKEIIYFACYATVIVLIVGNVMAMVSTTKQVVLGLQSLMQAVFPVLMTMLVALGGTASGATFHPLMSTLSVTVVGIMTTVILPCFIATIIFSIVGNLSKNIKLDKITKFFKSCSEFVLGLVFSVFVTILTIQGVVGSAVDGISIRSAKFALSSYVPILGGYLTDGFDLIFAGCVLIKNAVGLSGIMLLLSVILGPVIQIFMFSLVLKLSAGIIEPICDKRLSDLVYKISKNVTMLVAVILGVAFMFFIMVLFIMFALNVGGV